MKQANKFIKVHDADTNLPIGLLTDNIAAFESREYNDSGSSSKKGVKKTIIYFVNPITDDDKTYASIYINENVERLFDLIYESDKQ